MAEAYSFALNSFNDSLLTDTIVSAPYFCNSETSSTLIVNAMIFVPNSSATFFP